MQIIFPILIILFSILIIYAILQYQQNNKLNHYFESFTNDISDRFNQSIATNTMYSYEVFNGDWTSTNTIVDKQSYIAQHFVTIEITHKNTESPYQSNNGILTYLGNTYTIIFFEKYNCNFYSHIYELYICVIRTSGIEPELLDWKSNSLPLTYVRTSFICEVSLNCFYKISFKFLICSVVNFSGNSR